MKTSSTTLALRIPTLSTLAVALFVSFGLASLVPAAHAQTETASAVRAHTKDSDGTKPVVVVGGYQSETGDSTAADTSFTYGGAATAYTKDSDGTKPVVVVGGYQSEPGDSTLADTSFTYSDGAATAYTKDSDGTKPVVVVGGYQSEPGGGVDTTAVDTTFGGSYARVGGGARAELGGNAPNPFRSSTTIAFTLPEQQQARLAVYDLLGRRVAVLAEGAFTAGSHTVSFSASGLASGVYVYRLETENGSVTRRMTLAH